MAKDPHPGESKDLVGASPDLVGSNLEKRFLIAMVLYVVLAGLVWFTMGEGKVMAFGRPVELRLLPLVILVGLALRTVLARHAERIRRGGDRDRS